MTERDKILDFQEEQIPALAVAATTQAYCQALASGYSVPLQSENGVIYEVFPNGTRKVVKKIAPPTPVIRGTKFTLR